MYQLIEKEFNDYLWWCKILKKNKNKLETLQEYLKDLEESNDLFGD